MQPNRDNLLRSALIDLVRWGKMTKWQWKMDFCKTNSLPPAQKWAWDKADEAYNAQGPEFEGWKPVVAVVQPNSIISQTTGEI